MVIGRRVERREVLCKVHNVGKEKEKNPEPGKKLLIATSCVPRSAEKAHGLFISTPQMEKLKGWGGPCGTDEVRSGSHFECR